MLHIKVGARQILWPPVAQSVVSQIIDFVNSPTRKSQPILVHGFSVGGYLYGETLVRICEDAALKASMTKRVKGEIIVSLICFSVINFLAVSGKIEVFMLLLGTLYCKKVMNYL